MSVPTSNQDPIERSAAVTFDSVLCGIDGSRASIEAARQAAVIAGSGTLRLLSVVWEQGYGPTAVAVLSRWRAEQCLARAEQEVRELGRKPVIDIVDDSDATGRLLREAERHDLLVVGAHLHSRIGGIMTGSTASAAAHSAHVPILVARRPARGSELLDRVLVAVDGAGQSRTVAATAAQLVKRHGGVLTLVAPGTRDETRRRMIAECAADIRAAVGVEPVVVAEHEASHRAIVGAAAQDGSTMIVIGSRALTGAAAIRSVSERVVHEAPCSVLVLRPH